MAGTEASKKIRTFNFKTQKWTELAAAAFVDMAISPDGKYLYFTTGGVDPKVQRLRFADRRIESIADLRNLRQAVDPVLVITPIGVAPDGSPIFTRDIGTEEIYALNVRWPCCVRRSLPHAIGRAPKNTTGLPCIRPKARTRGAAEIMPVMLARFRPRRPLYGHSMR